MTDIPLHRIAAQFFNRPLLLTPDAGQSIADFLAGRMRAGRGGAAAGSESAGQTIEFFDGKKTETGAEAQTPRVSRFYGSTPMGADGRPLPFRRTHEGVAIVSVIGELVNRGAWIGASSGLISYEGIRHQMRAAAADPLSRAIILDLESPGGEAIGAFEAAAAVRAAAAVKPVVALVDGIAASGGYALASGATRIISIPSGTMGSVGVIWVHLDLSAALADAGVKPTVLFAGAHKADGNPLEPLSPAVRADMQAQVDRFYALFIECVAKGRGARLTADAARKTEARIFGGAEAVRLGLADATGTFEDVLAELAGGPGARRRTAEQVVATPAAAPPAARRSLVDLARAEAAAAAVPSAGASEPTRRPKGLVELARAEAGQAARPRRVEHLDLR